ncbi:MAG TPA: hypothetical protein VI542_03300 [Candidatus Tectomicrobia bacterium]
MAGDRVRACSPAFLDIPSVTVDESQRLGSSYEVALQAHRGLCSRSIVSACTLQSGTQELKRDKRTGLDAAGMIRKIKVRDHLSRQQV